MSELIISTRQIEFQGPLMLYEGYEAILCKIPVFIRNVSEGELFGRPRDIANCTNCYNATTREKFWGSVEVLLRWDTMLAGLDPLRKASAGPWMSELIISTRQIEFQGPLMLFEGYEAVLCKIPVFIRNVSEGELFGRPRDIANCTICYNATTREKFWGSVEVLLRWDTMQAGLDPLRKASAGPWVLLATPLPQPHSCIDMCRRRQHSRPVLQS
ncbi:predicted protein [Haematococcus lacustris]|uniref:Uncharacterized protein n=1 Tax=Haematococcus lacustris TaxID=44745 RepID=A0A699ZD56_HAELA|nr:predicted protein [Haematococcus lacustris]